MSLSRQMVPNDLNDARKTRSRSQEVRNFVKDEGERLFRGGADEEAQGRFPRRESASREICGAVAEIASQRLLESAQLDRLGLLPGTDKHPPPPPPAMRPKD